MSCHFKSQLVSSDIGNQVITILSQCWKKGTTLKKMVKFNPLREFKFDCPAEWPEWKQI